MENTGYNLDKKDKKILLELEKDSRQTNIQISRKAGLSPQAVAYRINNLEKQGILTGFWTVIDYQKLGFNCNNIFLKLKNLSAQEEKELIEYLRSVKGISWIAQTIGRWDIMLAFLYENLNDFNEIFSKICNEYYDKIQDYQITPNLDNYPLSCKLLYNDFNDIKIPHVVCGENKAVKIDSKDHVLLKELTNHARASITELSNKLGMTQKTVRNKMKRLMKEGVIQAFRPSINYNKLGYQWRICFLQVANFKESEKARFMSYAKIHPSITYLVNTIGHNINVDILTQHDDHFLEIKNELHKEFKDFIKNFEIVNVAKIYKRDFLPKKLEDIHANQKL